MFFEVAKRMLHGVHAQLHALPIPNSIPLEEVEQALLQTGKQTHIELSEEDLGETTDNYMQIELPGGKRLMHLIDDGVRFPLQFVR